MQQIKPTARTEMAGLLYGLLGVLGFSLTLPATRLAVAELDPTFVGLGRAIVAALLAALVLRISGQHLPERQYLRPLITVACGVVIGFPLLSAWALRQVPASHGAVMLGLLPLATAIAGVFRAGERPSWSFWAASSTGSALVVAFALVSGGGALHSADLALLGAVVAAALGYAEGGRLARVLGSWQVICWALLIAAPVLLIPVAWSAAAHGLRASWTAWACFGYVSVVSMLLGFFAWYRGLALGGIARVGQVQLLQPFFTLAASALFLGETITPTMIGVALFVALIVAIGRKASIQRPSAPAISTPQRSS